MERRSSSFSLKDFLPVKGYNPITPKSGFRRRRCGRVTRFGLLGRFGRALYHPAGVVGLAAASGPSPWHVVLARIRSVFFLLLINGGTNLSSLIFAPRKRRSSRFFILLPRRDQVLKQRESLVRINTMLARTLSKALACYEELGRAIYTGV